MKELLTDNQLTEKEWQALEARVKKSKKGKELAFIAVEKLKRNYRKKLQPPPFTIPPSKQPQSLQLQSKPMLLTNVVNSNVSINLKKNIRVNNIGCKLLMLYTLL